MKEVKEEMKEEMILLENVSKKKKNPPDELAQHVSKNNSPRTNFSFQSSESHTVFSIIYMIQIRIFGPRDSAQCSKKTSA